MKPKTIAGVLALASAVWVSACVAAQPVEPVLALAQKERPALLETLKELVAIESGSRETEELDKIANVIAAKFKALGAKVELIEPAESDTVRLSDTPEKIGRM